MFCFAGVAGQILGSGVFADDHPCVNVFLRTDEEAAALLNVVERVRRANSRFHRHHHTSTASSDFTLERRVFTKEMTHESFAAGQVEKIGLKTNQASSGNNRLDGYPRRVMRHADHLTSAIGNRLQNIAEIFVW